MLPINLLPNYIFDKNKKRNALIVYGVAIAAVAALFIVWSQGVQARLNEEKDRLATANDKKTKYDATVKQIQGVQDKIAVTKTKQTFIANAQTWNDAWPTQYDQLRNLTSKDVLLKSMYIQPDRKTVTMTAFAASEMVIAHWWQALKNQNKIFDNVTIQLPTHPYNPPGANGSAAGGMGGFPGMGGMPGSGGGPMRGMAGMAGMPGMGGMGMKGGMGGMGMGMGGGMGGGGGANSAEVGPAMIEDRLGVNFVATVVLKQPLAGAVPGVPVWPLNGGGGSAPGGMGGFPGMGGMPGMSGMPGSGGMGGSAGMMGGGGKMGKGAAD